MRVPSSIVRRVLCGSLLGASLASCAADSSPSASVAQFQPGDKDDPVLQQALSSMPAANTVLGGVGNNSGATIGEGLVTLSPLFTNGTAPSAALADFVAASGAGAGDARLLAQRLGLRIGIDAMVVPAAPHNDYAVFPSFDLPAGAKLSYVARTSAGRFTAALNQAAFNAAGKAVFIEAALSGYTISAGRVAGAAAPANSKFYGMSMSDCSWGGIPFPVPLFQDGFADGLNKAEWPGNTGYAGDFNGDWYTDGTTVRHYNASWVDADPAAPKPTVTGFIKFISVCPLSGARLSVGAKVNTALLSSAQSDTTLVVYYFNAAGGLISVDANYPLHKGSERTTALYDSAVPNGTRRIAVVPMAYIASDETNTVFFDSIDVTYEPNGSYSTRAIASEKFTTYTVSAAGKNQPTGWADFGGDWFVDPTPKWATLWNSKWGGDQSKLPPVDTGLVKSFALGSYAAGDVVSGRFFAAATFTDPTSFVRLRLVFNDASGTAVESDRLSGSSYSYIDIRRAAIPSGATSVQVIINSYLGPDESSSLYVDDLSVSVQRKLTSIQL